MDGTEMVNLFQKVEKVWAEGRLQLNPQILFLELLFPPDYDSFKKTRLPTPTPHFCLSDVFDGVAGFESPGKLLEHCMEAVWLLVMNRASVVLIRLIV
ncbi:hypothetical protein CEXT_71221 [Caerostris extrusa]|uniref:Uncharacterized protein n=1 Tax=Caerostris extrusa TaxID=172846 RepID=A0AAV4U548_CAEEX|nr:hypothetical protein CEXT_71221 [Caerostris extrusa]